jgi:hypothetical protein
MDGTRYLEDGRLTLSKLWRFLRSHSTFGFRQIHLAVLKTANEQNAIDLGRRLLFNLEQRVDRASAKIKIFAAVIDDYIRYRARSSPRQDPRLEC